MKKYNLDLVAATFIILDSNEASMQVSLSQKTAKKRKLTQTLQIACEWQRCMGGQVTTIANIPTRSPQPCLNVLIIIICGQGSLSL